MALPPAYPYELERRVVLRDGRRVRLRPIRPDDAPRLIGLYGRLSAHTAYQRFFTIMRRLPPDWARFLASVDYHRRLALVAEREGEAELVGVGRYEMPDRDGAAEVAFVVEDAWQGAGLGHLLVEAVLAAGAARGIRRFRAYVLSGNRRMLGLLARHGEIVARRVESGVTELVIAPRPAADSRPGEVVQSAYGPSEGRSPMAQPLSPDVKQLLDGPNFAHLATLMPDGSPQSVPVWVGREGDRLLICTGEGSLKARNTRRDPRVALSIVDVRDPYREAQLRGRVVERRPDPTLQIMDPISHKYTGKPFPFRDPAGRVALVIEVEKARYAKLPFQHTPPAVGA